MLTIVKLRDHEVLSFAAEELKKYLRMMMPEAGDVAITYDPQGTEGFRLGLLSDFGLSFHGKNPKTVDEIYIDTTKEGGILAGANPRAVLFAVYRFLKLNGCRFLFPGVDGEIIPLKDITPQKYHHIPSYNTRGHCNEGSESQVSIAESIDFYAKQELNTYSIEFKDPFVYYHRYYNHTHNQMNRTPEPVSHTQTLQWKRLTEHELAKRGLSFTDIGHGWTAEPFGLDSSDGWHPLKPVEVREDQKKYLAMLNGKRELYDASPLKTNLCMSNPEVQEIMAEGVVRYAENHQNEGCLAFSLADSARTHCECEECRKLNPSDHMIAILNKIDEKMTERGIETRVGFGAYHDTQFTPKKERLKNPDRFSMSFCPITRSYTASYTGENEVPPVKEFKLNDWPYPETVEECVSYLLEWQKIFTGDWSGFEYHFWIHQFNDPGLMTIARRIYEDILSLKILNLDGYVEDSSRRSFFPHGWHSYIFAEALRDRELDYEEVKKDYFSHLYGEDWEKVVSLMDRVSDVFDFAYLEGEKSIDLEKGRFYNPEQALRLEKIPELAAEIRGLAKAHTGMSVRAQSVAWQLLPYFAEYIEGLAKIHALKAQAKEALAAETAQEFYASFGRHEIAIERFFDHFLMVKQTEAILKQRGKSIV